jgi:hypothetical protein
MGTMGCYDHALHVRAVILGEVQIPACVCQILTTDQGELYEKHPQSIEEHGIVK